MFVYTIVNSESLKLYVGQHKGDNLRKYMQTKFSNAKRNSGTRSHLFAAMRKYPRGSWSIHPLVSGIESKVELDELERHYIRVLKCQHPDIGYNICDGGEGNASPRSESTKRKMRRIMKGRDPVGRALAQTLDARQKRSETFKRLGIKPPVHSMLGFHFSAETKARWSAKRKGSIPWNKGRTGLQVAWNKGLKGNI